MTNDFIIVKAKIYLKTTKEGGRMRDIKSGYRPNHAFEQPKDIRNIKTFIGDIQFDDQEVIEPGETKIVTVRFLRNETAERFITVEKKWFIYEVPRLVAEGEIIEI